MKIDVVVSSLKGGGAERVATNIANSFAASGHDVRILIQTRVQEVEYLPSKSVTVESFFSPNRFARALLLRRALNSRRADAVLAIQSNMAVVCGIIGLGLGLKIIGCEHNIPRKSVFGLVWTALRPFAYRQLDAVAVLTVQSKAELSKICPKVRIEVVPNALQLPLSENRPLLDPETVVSSDVPLVLAAGRLVIAKGFDRLIGAFSNVLAYCPDAKLVIVGEGPLRSELEKQVQDHGLEDSVLLPGRAGNMATWYRRAQLFVMTSRWEGQPMVLMEAMGHGLPALVTDFETGPRDIIRDGVDGIIVDKNLPETSPMEFGRAVGELLADSELRGKFAKEAVQVTGRFSEVEIRKKWLELIASL